MKTKKWWSVMDVAFLQQFLPLLRLNISHLKIWFRQKGWKERLSGFPISWLIFKGILGSHSQVLSARAAGWFLFETRSCPHDRHSQLQDQPTISLSPPGILEVLINNPQCRPWRTPCWSRWLFLEGNCCPHKNPAGTGFCQAPLERSPRRSFSGRICDPTRDPCWSSLFLKDTTQGKKLC